jgi:glyoxylase I family protein
MNESATTTVKEERAMPELKGVAHFSIPVSDVDRSIKFYTEVVGCKLLSSLPNQSITFLDAGGVCLLLIKRPAPVAKGLDEGSDGVHHAFIIEESQYQSAKDELRKKGVEIFFEEDRRGGIIDGPRFYFRDPDGTPLEFINRTHYAQNGMPKKTPNQ